jgi:ribosomal protein S18 acetylase RimI-like enzyme
VIPVRRARPEDVPALAASLARAFFADPVAGYLFPDPDHRREALPRFFTLQLAHNYLARGEVYTTDARIAASLWMPPRARPPRLRDRFAHLLFAPTLGDRLATTRHLTQLLESHHPVVPHYYLGTIGTDPDYQSRGIASALLAPVLERCDVESLPAYLECSREENVAFYEHRGFDVQQQLAAPDEGPLLWLMWREPKG